MIGRIACLMAGLALAGCSHRSAPTGSPPPTTTGATPRIGWIDQPLRPGVRLALLGTIPTSVRSAPPCRADQLSIRADANPGAGTNYADLYLTNASTTACTVKGEPRVELVGADGRVVAQTAEPGSTGSGLVLVARSSVSLPLGGIANDFEPRPCPLVSRVVLDLGSLGFASASTASTSPDQNPIVCSQVTALHEGHFAVVQAQTYTNQIRQVFLYPLPQVRPGTVLDYLTLIHLDSASALGPDFFPLCPIYRERLTDGSVRHEYYYELNCTALAGIRDQPWVVFGMQVPIARDLRPGSHPHLTWTAIEPLGPSASATITVARGGS